MVDPESFYTAHTSSICMFNVCIIEALWYFKYFMFYL